MIAHESASPAPAPPPLRGMLADAVGYWEPRRLGYNALLALLANLCYCAAYLVDIPLQYSPLRAFWRERRRVLWLLGAILAAALTWYWVADEIYPSV